MLKIFAFIILLTVVLPLVITIFNIVTLPLRYLLAVMLEHKYITAAIILVLYLMI